MGLLKDLYIFVPVLLPVPFLQTATQEHCGFQISENVSLQIGSSPAQKDEAYFV